MTREVRVADVLHDELDARLGLERADGRPSATDFLLDDLPDAIQAFADGFDDLPPTSCGVAGARIVLGPGRVVPIFAVYGVLLQNDALELIGVSVHFDA